MAAHVRETLHRAREEDRRAGPGTRRSRVVFAAVVGVVLLIALAVAVAMATA